MRWRLRFEGWLLSTSIYRFFFVYGGTAVKVCGAFGRMMRGSLLRIRCGMSVDRAIDAASKVENRQLDKEIQDAKNERYLAQRQLDKLKNEVEGCRD